MPTTIIPIRQINLPVNVQNVPLEIWLNGTKATVAVTTRTITPVPVINKQINLSVGPPPVQFKIQPVSVLLPLTGAETGLPGPPGPPGSSGPPGPPGAASTVPGPPGTAATATAGTTTTGAPGTSANVVNAGTTSAAVFNFTIPRGDVGAVGPTGPASTVPGPAGPQGSAATVAAGTTTTGAPGTAASVTNSGSSSAAVFNFTIPRGDVGATGPPGPSGSGTGDMLKSVYDTNANNIVDAAESVPWTGVSGKPSTFAPTAHASTHLSAGSDPISIASATLAGLCPMVDNTTIQVVASKLSTVALAWTAITGKPSTFPPDNTAMLKSIYDTNADNIVDHAALADAAPWTGITGKPSTFAPSAHSSTHLPGGGDAIASATATASGLVPTPPNNTTTFLRGDATFAAIPGGGDMLKTTYDTDNNGVVDTCDSLVWSRVTGVPLASTSLNGLLKQTSGLTTDFVDGTNACQNLDSGVARVISQRTRGYNAIGNPNFEVDQASVGTTVANANGKTIDRWFANKVGTMVISAGQNSASWPTDVLVPGTSFCISRSFWRITLTTAQASLGASDNILLQQVVEAPNWRELSADVHSISLLVRSSVAGLKFGLALRDSPVTPTRSLLKLCTIPSASTWTLITLPNLPVWPSGGVWNNTPGLVGYYFTITLAGGSTYIPGANDTWQTGNFIAAVGQDNFASKTIGSTFDLAFVQHEPGSICTQLQNKPFAQNYDECLRYFQKSYAYATALGAASTQAGTVTFVAPGATAYAVGTHRYHKPMAKSPAPVLLYNWSTGASGSVRDTAGTDHASAAPVNNESTGFGQISFSPATAGAAGVYVHYTADTGW